MSRMSRTQMDQVIGREWPSIISDGTIFAPGNMTKLNEAMALPEGEGVEQWAKRAAILDAMPGEMAEAMGSAQLPAVKLAVEFVRWVGTQACSDFLPGMRALMAGAYKEGYAAGVIAQGQRSSIADQNQQAMKSLAAMQEALSDNGLVPSPPRWAKHSQEDRQRMMDAMRRDRDRDRDKDPKAWARPRFAELRAEYGIGLDPARDDVILLP